MITKLAPSRLPVIMVNVDTGVSAPASRKANATAATGEPLITR